MIKASCTAFSTNSSINSGRPVVHSHQSKFSVRLASLSFLVSLFNVHRTLSFSVHRFPS